MEADEKFLRSFFQKATTCARRRPPSKQLFPPFCHSILTTAEPIGGAILDKLPKFAEMGADTAAAIAIGGKMWYNVFEFLFFTRKESFHVF
jgi:hypothetical protein